MVLTTFGSNIRKQDNNTLEPLLLLALRTIVADNKSRIPSSSWGILVHEIALHSVRVEKRR